MGTESARLSRTGVRIGCAGTGRDQGHADPAAGTRESRRHEPRALLICRDDQGHPGLVLGVVTEYGVVNRQNRAAAVAENRIHSLVGQHLNEHLRTRHAGAGEWVCGLI